MTERGPGFWVLAPLRSDSGFTVLVNRGFVPEGGRVPALRRKVAGEPARVVGLLRSSEPGGGFLRANDPAGGRWYSRDVAAIAAAQGSARSRPISSMPTRKPSPARCRGAA